MKKIAQQIYTAKENIILIYAFNSTGKTRLSVEYKNYTKGLNENSAIGVYYNAYSEDLFQWNNDEENDNQDIKLNIIPSSLNHYHSNLDEELILDKLAPYKPKYKFFFNPLNEENLEDGFGSISFYLEEDESQTPIKISRGEERIFIWCFFLALFEVEGLTKKHNQHFFIDDPVSSLDDHNIFITAHLLLELLKKHCNDRKIIITTHHMGIFSILQDWLKKGEYSGIFKSVKITEKNIQTDDGKTIIERTKQEENKYLVRFLENSNGEYRLIGRKKAIHLYHLLLLQILKNAITTDELNTYHFVLLRQVLECVTSFLGEGRFGYTLDILFPEESEEHISMKADIINALSHDKIYTQKIALLSEDNRVLLHTVIERLISTFHFSI
jgi:hypothetical protein